MQLKPRRRRRRSSTVRLPRAVVGEANERWAMDCMHDVLATGQRMRVFTLVDVFSRECMALEVAKSFRGADVARMLSDAGERAGRLPPIIQCDNGTSSPRPRWITGPTGIAFSWTSVDRGNPWITPFVKPSTAR
ncbi:MAG: DDE-type integrase/transposase/recombinase [bacterium]